MLSDNISSTTCLPHSQPRYYDKPKSHSSFLPEGESSRQITNNASHAIPCAPTRCITSNKDMSQFSTGHLSDKSGNAFPETVAFPNPPSFDLRAGEAFEDADTLPTRRRDSASDIPPAEHSSTFPRVKAEFSHAPLPSFERPSSSELRFIRKKSGEVVKPSLRVRAKSAPAPTRPDPKVVHFDKQLEHVCLFRPRQRPHSISGDGSLTDTSEGETSDGISFPAPLRIISSTLTSVPEDEPWTFDVRLESLVPDLLAQSLLGTVLVRNIAFAKSIVAHFTVDAWQTISEVIAHHVSSVRDGAYDRFEFRISLADIRKGRVVLCVRYGVQEMEFWDNNHGKNYEVDFDHAPRKFEVPADLRLRMRLGRVVLDGDTTPRNLLRRPVWHGVGGDTGDTDDDVIPPAPRIRPRLPSPHKHPLATTPPSRYPLSKSLSHSARNPPTSPTPRAQVPAGPARTSMSSAGLCSPRDSMEGRHHVRSVERESWLFAKGSPVRGTPRTQYVPPVDGDTSTPSAASASASSSSGVSPVILAHALPGITEGSKPYRALVDQFCFFAGESGPHRTSYGSGVEDYFSCTPQNAEFSSPTLAVVG